MTQTLQTPKITGIAATLSQCDLFASLSMEELLKIAAISEIVTFKKGAKITTAGTHINGTYVVQSGLVKATTNAPTENQTLTAIVKTGMCFGLMSVVPGKDAIVNSEAFSPVKLIFIPSEPFLNLYKAIPELPLNVSATLSEHIRHLITRAHVQKSRSIEARLAGWMLDQPAPILEDTEEISEDGKPCVGVITMDMSKAALARELGVTQQTLSRALMGFRKTGLASSKRKQIFIFDRAGIQAWAEESHSTQASRLAQV